MVIALQKHVDERIRHLSEAKTQLENEMYQKDVEAYV